jgi:hypothetical protein
LQNRNFVYLISIYDHSFFKAATKIYTCVERGCKKMHSEWEKNHSKTHF